MALTSLRTRKVVVAGVASPVLEGGTESADAVVFVHGNPGSAREWTALATAASEFARVLAPDMPGFGRADKPRDFEYTVDGYARHLAGLLDAGGVRRAHLVLHDFGCPWGLAWAAAHPDALASVTLMDSGILPGYRWHRFARIWQTPLLGELLQALTFRWLFRTIVRHQDPHVPRDFVDAMYDEYGAGTRRAVVRLYRATPDVGALTGSLAGTLRGLRRPALVLWGRDDPYMPARYAERQRETFPDARVVVLEHSGHWPHADAPDAVREALLPFLRAQLGSPRPPSTN